MLHYLAGRSQNEERAARKKCPIKLFSYARDRDLGTVGGAGGAVM
jgi:hypothetical protein